LEYYQFIHPVRNAHEVDPITPFKCREYKHRLHIYQHGQIFVE